MGWKTMASLLLALSWLYGCAYETVVGIEGDQDAGADTAELVDASWDPPLDLVGEVGWRASTEPWCPDLSGSRMAFAVWSHPGEVFVAVADNFSLSPFLDTNYVYVNQGSGWHLAIEVPIMEPEPGLPMMPMFMELRGTTDGTLFAYSGGSGRLVEFDAGDFEFSDFEVTSFFIVHDSLAWACADVGLLKWDGVDWRRELTDPCGEGELWADEESVFVAAGSGLVKELGDGEWITHDTGYLYGFSAIWGFSPIDIWVAAGRILVHYDGTTWDPVEWDVAAPASPGIRQLWGINGVLFINAASRVVKYEDGVFEHLGVWPLPNPDDMRLSVHQIWGNSPTEVFLAIEDYEYTLSGCGDYYMLRWDGTEFHWF